MVINDDLYLSMLTMTCTIQRDDGTGGKDESGKAIQNFKDLETGIGVRCLLQSYFLQKGRKAVQIVQDTNVVIEDTFMFLPAGTDVEINDGITTIVRTKDSVTIEDGPLYISGINKFDDAEVGDEHHIELVLKRPL